MSATLPITPLHIERGRQMRQIVRHDIARGLSFDQAVSALASFLAIDAEAITLAIAIANEADAGNPDGLLSFA